MLPMWPDVGSDNVPSLDDAPATPAKTKKPKTARGFKGLAKTTIADVLVHSASQVMVLSKTGKTYFMIEASVVDGEPMLKCSKHKVVKYKHGPAKRPTVISKFAT